MWCILVFWPQSGSYATTKQLYRDSLVFVMSQPLFPAL